MSDLDFSSYVSPTRFGAADGIVLGMQLLTAAPESPPPRIRQALERLREEVVTLQDIARDRLAPGGPVLRGLAQRLGSAYVGARMRLDGLVRFSSTEEAERATRLRDGMLPQGTRFVMGEASEVWTTSDLLLQHIDETELAREIDELVGPTFLPFVRARHAALGEALGVGETAVEAPDPRSVRDQLGALARAIATYGRVMVGWVDPDDEESLATFRRAMGPLDRHRARLANGGGAADEPPAVDDDPDTPGPEDPVPPVPPADGPIVTDPTDPSDGGPTPLEA